MEQFKKDIFLKNNHTTILYDSVSENDMQLIADYLNSKGIYNLDTTLFYNSLKQYLTNSKTFENLESKITLKKAFEVLGVGKYTRANIIWKFPEDIDTFNLNYLIAYWDDIWFKESDEAIAIFFPEPRKMILIAHWDLIYF